MQKAIEYINIFEERVDSSIEVLTNGFGHGYISVAVCMLEIYKSTKTDKYLKYFEKYYKLANVKSELDICNLSWCKGLIGEAIGRIRIISILNECGINSRNIEVDLSNLHHTIEQSTLLSSDCLCHGNSAISEYYMVRYENFHDISDLNMASAILENICTNYLKNGEFMLKQYGDVRPIGLFDGEFGVIYSILRCFSNCEIPSVLY